MPYDSVSDVPDNVPKGRRRQWMHVWNSTYKARLKAGDDAKEAERRAFAAANSVAGPNATKVMTPRELAELLKAIGTEATGFVRAVDGPFRCAHCAFFAFKKVDDGDGVCREPDVNKDPGNADEPRSNELLIVANGDCCNEYEPVKKEKAMRGQLKKFIPFAKVDSARREVWGIVTAEVPDKDDEVCDYFKSKPNFEAVIAEMSKATDGDNFFPLRAMHDWHKAVGKCVGFEFRDADREVFMGFKVVDDREWRLVEEKVYTGFSQGGALEYTGPDPVYEGCKRYVAHPSEVSLVDNPCLATAHFTHVKVDGSVELCKFAKTAPVEPGGVSAAVARELALIKAHVGLGKTNESLDRRRTAVCNAISDKFNETDPKNASNVVEHAWVREFFDDHAVFERDGKLFSVDYAIDEKENVKLGAPAQVEVEYVPIGKAAAAKGKTKRVAGEDLPASAFLIVLDPERTETWNLPVRFSSEAKSKRHVRNALARLSQLKDVPQDKKDAAHKKLVALAERYGIDVKDEQKKLAAVRAYLQKRARVAVNRIARTAPGGNVGVTLAALDNDLGRLAKGMGAVCRLACVVDELCCLAYNVTAEEKFENEPDSPLSGLLADNVESLLDTLLRMIEEESEEIREDVRSRAGA